ncbi:MAG: class I SAM-dependent methyltransferase [Candidatus Binatia bacterium]
MTNLTDAPLEDRLIELMRHLGIERAHFAACMPRDWVGLLNRHKNAVASLTLMCPMGIDLAPLSAEPPPLLIVTGDQGRGGLDAIRDGQKIAGARSLILKNYFSPPWADPIGDRRDAIGIAMRGLIETNALGDTQRIAKLLSRSGECAGITYSCHGSGEPLLLMPLALSPSQWQPLIEQLSENFSVITLGGAHLGMVAHLETRAQSSYMRVIDQLFHELNLRPGHSILEVGCGPGAIVRRLAARTRGVKPIVAVDVNRYLVGEAVALAKREGLDGYIEFHLGDATQLPFADNRFDRTISCTVMEEGDADRMLSDFVRVTKPGGKVGSVTRSTDLPRWVNLPLSQQLKAKVDSAGLFGGNVTDKGCADASLYRRMNEAGLKDVAMLPQWASHKDGERLDYLHERIVALLTPDEFTEWRAALDQAKGEGTFFIAEPFHCAVGRKQ